MSSKRFLKEFVEHDSQNSIKKLYGDCKSGGFTTDKTKPILVETKLCCDMDTSMVYYSFIRKGKVYPLAPYLRNGKFMKILQVSDIDNVYIIEEVDKS